MGKVRNMKIAELKARLSDLAQKGQVTSAHYGHVQEELLRREAPKFRESIITLPNGIELAFSGMYVLEGRLCNCGSGELATVCKMNDRYCG